MAIPSIAQFRARYPEFGTTSANGASDELIQLAIAEAAETCDETVYGDRHTQAVLCVAADEMARSPFARAMKLVEKNGETAYSQRSARLRRIAAFGIRAL